MTIQKSWLVRGYFDLSGEDSHQTTTRAIRDLLSTALGRPLRIATYPVGPNWKHTFWWREGTEDYAEAQFFLRISEDYPVLSAGVSVEKGLEGAAIVDLPEADSRRMDRGTWDWQRLMDRRSEILGAAVPQCSADLGHPLSLRVRTHHKHQLLAVESASFCFSDGQWFKRHHGLATVASIATRLEELDQCADRWVDLYFAIDLDPSSVHGLKAADAASILLKFGPIRRQLRS